MRVARLEKRVKTIVRLKKVGVFDVSLYLHPRGRGFSLDRTRRQRVFRIDAKTRPESGTNRRKRRELGEAQR